MKKFISVLLCVLMLVPMFAFGVNAADENEEDEVIKNVAKSGFTYATGTWNYYSHHKYMIDGTTDSTYEFWRPANPGAAPPYSNGYMGNYCYCGIRFNQYYELYSIDMFAQINQSNVQYTVTALVNGEWTQVAKFDNNGFDPKSLYQVSTIGTCAEYKIQFDQPVTTKNLRIECEGYVGNSFPPIIEELEIYGKLGKTPEYDLKEGAVISLNACLGAMMEASSSVSGRPAAFGADTEAREKDGIASTVSPNTWKSRGTDDGESITAVFEKEFEIDSVSLNFGNIPSGDDGQYVVDIDLLVDGVWKAAKTDISVTTSSSVAQSLVYTLNEPVIASAMKVTFTSTNGKAAVLNEMGAKICDGKKTVFLSEYLTNNRKQALAVGNLAPYGDAYASSTFDYSSISNINYLNDGSISETDYSWIAGTTAVGTYCGIKLIQKHLVDNVILYFNDSFTKDGYGDHVLSYDIMAKVGEEFVKVGEGTSYDGNRYQVSIKLAEPVETDDIRIVFTSCGQTYPYLKELEIYQTGYIYPSYENATTARKVLSVSKNLAERSYVKRSSFLDTISPVQNLTALLEFSSMEKYI